MRQSTHALRHLPHRSNHSFPSPFRHQGWLRRAPRDLIGHFHHLGRPCASAKRHPGAPCDAGLAECLICGTTGGAGRKFQAVRLWGIMILSDVGVPGSRVGEEEVPGGWQFGTWLHHFDACCDVKRVTWPESGPSVPVRADWIMVSLMSLNSPVVDTCLEFRGCACLLQVTNHLDATRSHSPVPGSPRTSRHASFPKVNLFDRLIHHGPCIHSWRQIL